MGLTPPSEPASVPSLEGLSSGPDVQRLLEIKKTYQFWQQHMKDSEKAYKDDKSLAMVAKGPVLSKGILLSKGDLSVKVKQAVKPQSLTQKVKGNHLHFSNTGMLNHQNLFTEKDMLFLKSRLGELVSHSLQPRFKDNDKLVGCMPCSQDSQGFDPYGTKDEAGLHDENGLHDEYCLTCDEDDLQDDYDLNEVHDENGHLYSHTGTTHHIEVELNDGPPRLGTPDPDEPSCEFTFEYDGNGKLVPTSNNIEEKLRQMNLTAQLNIDLDENKPSNKKKKKKKRRTSSITGEAGILGAIDESLCLFCQYEAFYGHKPVHTMQWLQNKVMKEETRRKKLQDKLESVKQAAKKLHRPEPGPKHDHENEQDEHDEHDKHETEHQHDHDHENHS